jgi:ankyrin repeat protein
MSSQNLEDGTDVKEKSVSRDLSPTIITRDMPASEAGSEILRKQHLWFAAKNGNAQEVASLLKHPDVDVNAVNQDGRTALWLAALCDRGNPGEVARLLLEYGNTDINIADRDGATAIYSASKKGNLEVVKLLMKEKHLDVNYATNDSGSTPLITAVRHRHPEVVEQLLTHEYIGVNSRDSNGRTALHVAVLKGSEEMVQRLLATNGIKICLRSKNGYTPAQQAAALGKSNLVKLLLPAAKCAEPGSYSKNNNILHIAAKHGHAGVVTTLLAHAEDVNTQDESGSTALHYAAHEGHVEIVQLLLNVPQVNIHAPDKKLETPLARALRRKHTAVTKMLMKKDSTETMDNDPNGQAIIRYAILKGERYVVEWLLRRERQDFEVDVNAVDGQGRTLMLLALEQHDEGVIKALLRDDFRTLHLLVQRGELQLVKKLLEAGYDVNETYDYDATPLHTAISSGHLDIAKELVS